jgi:hemerythrin-like domain-containing protein
MTQEASMKATIDLEQDHRIIELVFPALLRLGEQARAQSSFDAKLAGEVVEFVRTFADAYHHGKEELHLFRVLEQRGVPRTTGLVHQLLLEHGQGRAHVRAMAAALTALASGDDQAPLAFSDHAVDYVALLQGHIRTEDTDLWDLCRRTLSAADDTEIMAGAKQAETALGGANREAFRQRAHTLTRRASV